MTLDDLIVEVEFTADVWTSITSRVASIDIDRGRSSELDHFQPGLLDVLVDNSDRALDPTYTSSPYWPNVKPGRRIRVLTDYTEMLTATQRSFESGTTTGWSGSGSITADNAHPAHAGTYYANINSLSSGSCTATLDAETVTPGNRYTASAWVRGLPGGTPARAARFNFSWRDGDDVVFATDAGPSTTDADSVWRKITATFVAPVGAASVIVQVIWASAAANEQHLLDDVSLAEISGLFRGFIDEWPQVYNHPAVAWTPIKASDDLSHMAAADPGTSIWEFEVRDSEPLHWWRLSELTGTTVVDSGGTPINGTYQGGVTLGSTSLLPNDETTTSATFTGAATSYATLPSTVSPTTPDVTVAFWLNAGNPGATVTMLDLGPLKVKIISGGSLRFLWTDDTATTTTYAAGVLADGVNRFVVATLAVPQIYQSAIALNPAGAAATTPAAAAAGAIGALNAGTERWTGILDEVVVWDRTLTAAEVSDLYEAASLAWEADLSGERIHRLLDGAQIPQADRDVDDGASTLQAQSAPISSLLEHAEKVEESERGAFFFCRDGIATFVDRTALAASPYSVSQATFGDGVGEIPYEDVQFDYSNREIRNEIRVSSQGQPTIVAADTASMARPPDGYGRRTYSRTGLLNSDVTDLQDAADELLAAYKDPYLRVRSLKFQLLFNGSTDDNSRVTHGIERDLMDRITVKRKPQNLGSAISQVVRLHGIRHSINFRSRTWRVTWTLGNVG